jgi:hypothetical protein
LFFSFRPNRAKERPREREIRERDRERDGEDPGEKTSPEAGGSRPDAGDAREFENLAFSRYPNKEELIFG